MKPQNKVGKPENADSLADFFARIICSRHNQHVIVRIVGRAGTGKSWLAIELACETSKRVAYYMGGVPEDYYNLAKNLACMSKDRIKAIMDNPGEFNILHLDDLGVPLNARKFMDEDNIDFNDILQTFRPNHNLVIMTLQAGFLVDKVPRLLAHYEIEMEQQNFDRGYSIAKVNEIVYKHKIDQVYFPYIFINGTKYVRHVSFSPPKEFTVAYEIERASQLKAIQEKKDVQEEKVTKLSLSEQFGLIWKKQSALGISNEIIAKSFDISPSTISRFFKNDQLLSHV